MICPACQQDVKRGHFACHSGAKGGKSKSAAKLKAAAQNAKKGGWPKGKPRQPRKG